MLTHSLTVLSSYLVCTVWISTHWLTLAVRRDFFLQPLGHPISFTLLISFHLAVSLNKQLPVEVNTTPRGQTILSFKTQSPAPAETKSICARSYTSYFYYHRLNRSTDIWQLSLAYLWLHSSKQITDASLRGFWNGQIHKKHSEDAEDDCQRNIYLSVTTLKPLTVDDIEVDDIDSSYWHLLLLNGISLQWYL